MIPRLRVLRCTRARAEDVRRGLLAYLRLEIDRFIVDGVCVRRTSSGVIKLSYPARTDGSGARHPYLRPVHDVARREVEAEVLRQLAERVDLDAGTKEAP